MELLNSFLVQIKRLIRSWIIVVCILVGIEADLFSQHYFTQNYTEADGLASNMIFDVAQDTSGILWFATRLGVSSYDGNQWTNYNPTSSHMLSSFAHVMVDERGKLWAVPLIGEPTAYWFSGKEWHKFDCKPPDKYLVNLIAFSVFYDNDTPVVVLGTHQDGVFISKNKQWIHFTKVEGLIDNNIRGVIIAGDKVIIGTMKGLSVIHNGIVSNELNALLSSTSKEILAFAKNPNSETSDDNLNVYILGNRWLGVLTDSAMSMITQGFRLSAYKKSSYSFVYPDENGNLLFGNPYYFYSYSPEVPDVIEVLNKDNGLISDGATAVLIDREKNTWITSLRGITKIPSKRFSTFTNANGLFDNEVSSTLEYADGSYIFGHNGGISFFDGERFETMNFDLSDEMPEAETRVQDIDHDQKGNIWLAVSHLGIARIDKHKRVKWYRKSKGIEGNMVSVVAMQDGNIYALSDHEIFEYVSGDKFVPIPIHKILDGGIRKLFIGFDTTLYIATYKSGLIKKKGAEETHILANDNEAGNSVFAFLHDSQDRQWVGTTDGLYRVSGDELIKYDSAGLRINHPIYFMLEDHRGQIWFGTDNGVYRWSGKNLDHFTINDGLAGQELNRDAGFMDSQNNIWFGTNNGLTVFNPNYDYKAEEIPPPLIAIQWIDASGDTFYPGEFLDLKSYQNNLTFHFRAISFIDEEKIFYSCFLDGFDKQWSEEFHSHENQYRYNNLNPGTYRFCVKAENSLGIWSEPVCTGTIKIMQPFWFAWWFISIAVIVLGFVIYTVLRFSLTRLNMLRLERMVNFKTRELRKSEKKLKESNAAKDNFFSIIAHDLKSPFNAILGMLDLLTADYDEFNDQERQKILGSLKTSSGRTINLLENLLTWAQSQKGIIPFDPVRFDVMELIQENVSLFESAAEAKQITLVKPEVEIILVYADKNMINTVIRNLISNAIKFTSSDGEVSIHVENEGRHEVVVNVKDTGIGIDDNKLKKLFNIDKRITTKGTNNETGTGLGLILSQEFIIKNKGRIWITSEKGEGSTFWFSLPSKQEK